MLYMYMYLNKTRFHQNICVIPVSPHLSDTHISTIDRVYVHLSLIINICGTFEHIAGCKIKVVAHLTSSDVDTCVVFILVVVGVKV